MARLVRDGLTRVSGVTGGCVCWCWVFVIFLVFLFCDAMTETVKTFEMYVKHLYRLIKTTIRFKTELANLLVHATQLVVWLP